MHAQHALHAQPVSRMHPHARGHTSHAAMPPSCPLPHGAVQVLAAAVVGALVLAVLRLLFPSERPTYLIDFAVHKVLALGYYDG